MIELTFRGNALAVKTDPEGNAMLAFIGRKGEEGRIKGERYVRTLKTNQEGQVIKDHWELKGKV
jgi:hypothetical protein